MDNSVASSSNKVKGASLRFYNGQAGYSHTPFPIPLAANLASLVEYSDPFGIYPLISSDLQTRLPLRNLHWNSPSRPLRSIDSLYIDLVPDGLLITPFQGRSISSSNIPSQDFGPSTPGLGDFRKQSEAPRRERRHQIPGLRETPYLKLFLLRCDDVETYKASARKMLREWIKTHTPPSQNSSSSSNQENHDAFEWIIIHIVLPDPPGSSVWPSRASASVLDKIRSDFNGSSKSGMDRVCQIPSTAGVQVNGVTVNPIPSGQGHDQFLQEANRAWEDVLGKLKAWILSSFDLRVRQYEEDIKEKGSQRNIPGWNFCTFFVLKEGLARGFESVGLVEDALTGYDELAVELSIALRDQKEKAMAGQATGLFREHTQELLLLAELEFAGTGDASAAEQTLKGLSDSVNSVVDADKKPYRELILQNNISAFDFQCYVFARQVTLLARIALLSPLAATSTPRSNRGFLQSAPDHAAGSDDNEPIDLMILSEICRRAVRFVTSTGSTIREDLRSSFENKLGSDEATLLARYTVIENIISSWTYTACHQILIKADDPSFARQLLQIPQDGPVSTHHPRPSTPSTAPTSASTIPLPARSSSLLGRTPPPSSPPRRETLSSEFSPTAAQKGNWPSQMPYGLHSLAASRAELYLIARRALAGVALRQTWKTGWQALAGVKDESMDEVSLAESPCENVRERSAARLPLEEMALVGILDEDLKTALSSKDKFYEAYEVFGESIHASILHLIDVGNHESSFQIVPAVGQHEVHSRHGRRHCHC
jgi:hypothetical protein